MKGRKEWGVVSVKQSTASASAQENVKKVTNPTI